MKQSYLWLAMILTTLVGAFGLGLSHRSTENWPERNITSQHLVHANSRIAEYKASSMNASSRVQQYSMRGDYLNYGQTVHMRESAKLMFDDQGLPMIKYGSEFRYNPVTLGQFALAEYGRAIHGGPWESFDNAIDKTIE
jgi:hypothetical protein